MKKRALTGLVFLGIFVLLCIFFSGSFHTLTTAKVRMTAARTGKLESKASLTGSLHWPDTQGLYMPELGSEDSLTVTHVRVSVGSYVKQGDLLAECSVNDYQTRMEALETNYAAKEKELLELERKNENITIRSQQQQWLSSYQQLMDAMDRVRDLRRDLRLAAGREEIFLGPDDALPEGQVSEELTALSQALADAQKEEASARSAYERANRKITSEDVISYLTKQKELQEEMDQLTDSMVRLQKLGEESATLTAPWTGFITEVSIKAGDKLEGNTALMLLTLEGQAPVLRFDASTLRTRLPDKADIELTAGTRTLHAASFAQTVSETGQLSLDIPLIAGDLIALGGAAALSEANAATAQITWKEENSTTLIPLSALRGTTGDYYVYVVQETEDPFRQKKYTLSRRDVTILNQSESTVSVAESLRDVTLAHMEDRPISEGSEVLPYDN